MVNRLADRPKSRDLQAISSGNMLATIGTFSGKFVQ